MASVLVVDDDAEIARLVGRIVEFCGHTPLIVTDSFDVILHHRRGHQAAVIDYLMPRFDGLELLASIQEVEPSCRRILLTAAPDEAAVREALRTGIVQRVIEKPPSLLDMENALAWLE
jgi:DNA-binding NtrC family response regulator